MAPSSGIITAFLAQQMGRVCTPAGATWAAVWAKPQQKRRHTGLPSAPRSPVGGSICAQAAAKVNRIPRVPPPQPAAAPLLWKERPGSPDTLPGSQQQPPKPQVQTAALNPRFLPLLSFPACGGNKDQPSSAYSCSLGEAATAGKGGHTPPRESCVVHGPHAAIQT